jgi:hypothetical protein
MAVENTSSTNGLIGALFADRDKEVTPLLSAWVVFWDQVARISF